MQKGILLILVFMLQTAHSYAFGLAATYAGRNDQTKLFFFDRLEFQRWNPMSSHVDNGFPKTITKHWANLPNYISAALYTGQKNPIHPNKILFFKNTEYWQWDLSTQKIDPDYPKRISDDWPGLPHRIDAAVYAPYRNSNRKDKLYFFYRSEYWRWDIESNQVDLGYPKPIAEGWSGLPKGSIDMAVYSGAKKNKIYLFQGNRYWRWDLNTDLLDEGYPKRVSDQWSGLRF